jgi:hypothetical protein
MERLNRGEIKAKEAAQLLSALRRGAAEAACGRTQPWGYRVDQA